MVCIHDACKIKHVLLLMMFILLVQSNFITSTSLLRQQNIVICAWLLLLCIVIVTYHRKYFTRYLSIPYVCIVPFKQAIVFNSPNDDQINFCRRNAFQAELMTKATGLVLPSRIHGYRCRCPPCSSLLGAILGVGTQLFIM